MDEASEAAAVAIAAQGVIGKRVDEMEAGFMMALDYMIQLAEKDKDDEVWRIPLFSSSQCWDRKINFYHGFQLTTTYLRRCFLWVCNKHFAFYYCCLHEV